MFAILKRAAFAAALALPAHAHDGVHIHDPYARIINGNGAVYFQINNMAHTPDALIAASSPDAGMVGLMNSSEDANGVMQMRDVAGLEVEAGGTRTLSGGGDHVMLMAVPRKYKNGETVTLTLTFREAGDVTLTVPVNNARTTAPTAGPTEFDGKTAAVDRSKPKTGAMSMAPAEAMPDAQAITAVMKAQFDKPEAPLTVAPIVVMGDDAVASWAQGDMGGRALLKRQHGMWMIVLCGGPDLRAADFLGAHGVVDAQGLSAMFNAAEDELGAEKVALSSKFEGVVMMSEHAH